MTNEAMRLLRLQQLTRRRLVMLGGAVEVARVAPMAPNARSSPPGSDDDTPDESS